MCTIASVHFTLVAANLLYVDGTHQVELAVFRNIIGGNTTADRFSKFMTEVIDYSNEVRRNQRVSLQSYET